MFDSGTKIIIIASTKKSGIGPRKGSTGYASNCLNNRVFDQYGLVATLNEVFFCKYGFETQDRVEKKAIISIFPLIKPDQGDIRTQVCSLIKRVNSSKSAHIWDEIRRHFDVISGTPVTITAPLNCQRADLSNVSKNEFIAWIESVLSDRSLLNFLNSTINTKYYNNSKIKYIDYNTLNLVLQMMMDREYKKIRLITMTHDKERKKNTVTMIRAITVFAGNCKTRKKIDFYNSYVNNNSIIPNVPATTTNMLPIRAVMESITSNIYSPALFNSLKNIFWRIGNTSAQKIMEDIEYTKYEIMELSADLLKNSLVGSKVVTKV